MTASFAFWATYGLAGGAIVVALFADMLGLSRLARIATALLLLGAGGVALAAAWSFVEPVTVAGDAFRVGKAYSLVPGLIFALGAVAILASGRDRYPGQAAALIALGAVGGSLAATSLGLVTMLVGIETAAVSGYALVARGTGPRAAEASFKYFVQSSVATGLFVLGLAFLAGLFSTDAVMGAIAQGMGTSGGLTLAASFGTLAVVVAVAFKAGAAPFHSWAPDAYETAQPPSSAFLAGPVKLAMIATLVSVTIPFAAVGGSVERPYGDLLFEVFGALAVLAVLSIVVGSTVALTTPSYRRMLAYAGIAQVGYALIALASLGTTATLVLISTYAIGTLAAFLSAEYFERSLPDWDGSVVGLAGAAHRHRAVAAALTVALMSLAGIPPLLGFWGKFQAFGAAVNAATSFAGVGETTWALCLAGLAAVGVLGSIVSLAYYGNVVRVLYFFPSNVPSQGEEEASSSSHETTDVAGTSSVAWMVVVTSALLVILGLMPILIGYALPLRGFLLN